jgi:hypothetical protein
VTSKALIPLEEVLKRAPLKEVSNIIPDFFPFTGVRNYVNNWWSHYPNTDDSLLSDI